MGEGWRDSNPCPPLPILNTFKTSREVQVLVSPSRCAFHFRNLSGIRLRFSILMITVHFRIYNMDFHKICVFVGLAAMAHAAYSAAQRKHLF